MTAPRPEIQRLAFRFNNIAAMEGTEVIPESNGEYVFYSDHLRAVTLAKIEALKEASNLACYGCRKEEPTVEIMGAIYHLSGHLRARESCGSQEINERIAALRKELGDE